MSITDQDRELLIQAQQRAEERDAAYRAASRLDVTPVGDALAGYTAALAEQSGRMLTPWTQGVLDQDSICPDCNQKLRDHVPLGRIAVTCPERDS